MLDNILLPLITGALSLTILIYFILPLCCLFDDVVDFIIFIIILLLLWLFGKVVLSLI